MKLQKTKSERIQERAFAKFRKANCKRKKKPRKKKSPFEQISLLKQLTYREFLQTKYWAHVRKLVFKRDNFMCVICKVGKDLQVHHDTYKNHGNELEHLADLMTLCEKCHTEHHYAQL